MNPYSTYSSSANTGRRQQERAVLQAQAVAGTERDSQNWNLLNAEQQQAACQSFQQQSLIALQAVTDALHAQHLNGGVAWWLAGAPKMSPKSLVNKI